ncbi:MAG: biotin/lipoyl-containing protein, partial [Anaerolineaceae bacterium]
MAFEITMPQMGADMTEGTLLHWLKNVGDVIARGDILAEIETDKATVELEAFEAGTLLKQVASEGDVVPVGDIIALLGDPAEKVGEVQHLPPAETPPRRTVEPKAKPVSKAADAEPVAAEAPATTSTDAADTLEPAAVTPSSSTAAAPAEAAAKSRAAAAPPPAGASAASNSRLRISPVAKRIATEAGLDTRTLTGSGPDGRILRRDVEAAVAVAKTAAALPAGEQVAP